MRFSRARGHLAGEKSRMRVLKDACSAFRLRRIITVKGSYTSLLSFLLLRSPWRKLLSFSVLQPVPSLGRTAVVQTRIKETYVEHVMGRPKDTPSCRAVTSNRMTSHSIFRYNEWDRCCLIQITSTLGTFCERNFISEIVTNETNSVCVHYDRRLSTKYYILSNEFKLRLYSNRA